MKLGRLAQLALGGLLDLFGFVMLVGGMIGAQDEESRAADLPIVLVLGFVPMALGSFLIYRALSGLARDKREDFERKILDLAAKSAGRLSPAAVARETSLTLDEAKRKLDAIHLSGHCRTELQADGSMIYLFD